MSIQTVEAAAVTLTEADKVRDAAHEALMEQVVAAKIAGVSIAAIARAAGVSRQTADKWLRQRGIN